MAAVKKAPIDPVVPTAAPSVEQPKNGTESALISSFRAARRVSTPIVAIETPDPASTISSITKVLQDRTPIISWDCARGLFGLNSYGKAALGNLTVDPLMTVHCAEALLGCEKLPELTVVFMHNLHRQLTEMPVVQALWNLRDIYKVNKRMIVGLGPAFKLPAELGGDVIVLDEPLPTRDELSVTLDQQHKNAELPLPEDDVRSQALDALVGLASYTAEQVTAMSLTKVGIHVGKLWDRKITAIQNTEGLRVWKAKPGDTTMDELQGTDNVVAFARKLADVDAFRTIVFIDEMDKAFAGGMSEHTGDSGVSKDQVGTLLSYIEDTGSLGLLLAGIAGTGKTQLAKALGAYAGKPVIVFDLGGMKGGIVGKSEEHIRLALKVVTATAEGRVLFIGTANRTTLFTPELNRRFPDQFFYDTPDDAGRSAIWPVYVQKNGLTASQAEVPEHFDRGWTGAEIKRACERAALFGCSVVEAARYIIPSSVSGKAQNNELRRQAQGRFLSASYPGFYEMPPDETAPLSSNHRSIEV